MLGHSVCTNGILYARQNVRVYYSFKLPRRMLIDWLPKKCLFILSVLLFSILSTRHLSLYYLLVKTKFCPPIRRFKKVQLVFG